MSATLLDVAAARRRFSALDRRLAFFDGPGGTQCPDEVIDAVSRYLRDDNANVGAPYATSQRTDELVATAHERAGAFLGCDPGEVAFGQSMTALNFLLTRAFARELEPGDEVLVTRLDHDGNVAPWLALAEDVGIVVRFVDVHDDLSLDLDDLAAKRSPRTKVVAFPAAANSVGTAPDVKRVVELAHEANALAWVDAVHYGPHGPIDVTDWGCDVLLCSPYKFFGPHMGLAFGREALLRSWRPYKVRPAADEPVGRRFELGTSQHELLAGFVAAVDYVHSLGWDAMVEHERSLGRRFLDGLPRRRPAARLADDGRPRADLLLQRPGTDGAGRGGAPRRARRRRLVGQLLRARDDAPPRPRRGGRRRPGGDRPLQHGRGGRPAAPRDRGAGRTVRLLLLGGPKFLGRALIDAALERGHELTLFNRGTTGADLYPDVERIVGDRDGGLDGLSGREWDAVVDTSGYLPRVVGASAGLLADTVEHYVFVSSISVYGSFADVVDEEAPPAELSAPGSEDIATDYGALKALCEQVVERAFPGGRQPCAQVSSSGRTTRPGGSRTGRTASRAAATSSFPAPPGASSSSSTCATWPAWMLLAAEERLGGRFNATGPATMGAVIDAAKRVAGSTARPVEVDDAFLADQGVGEWMELPLWVDTRNEPWRRFMEVDASRATAAGLTFPRARRYGRGRARRGGARRRRRSRARAGARAARRVVGARLGLAARGSNRRRDRVDREALVHLAGQPAHPDSADPLAVDEDRDAAQEEREERVEARQLGRRARDLLGERPGRRRVAPRRGIRLPSRVEFRVERRAVHANLGDNLAVVVRDDDRDGAGGLLDHAAHDRERDVVRESTGGHRRRLYHGRVATFERTTLSNGTRVLTALMSHAQSVSCFVMFAAGSRYERREESGIAHFAEHMFFKGTDRRPTARDIATEIDSIGGEFNAFTGKEVTGYYVKCAAETRTSRSTCSSTCSATRASTPTRSSARRA